MVRAAHPTRLVFNRDVSPLTVLRLPKKAFVSIRRIGTKVNIRENFYPFRKMGALTIATFLA